MIRRDQRTATKNQRIKSHQDDIAAWEKRIIQLDWWLLGTRQDHAQWSRKASERNNLHTRVSDTLIKINRMRNDLPELISPSPYHTNITVNNPTQ